MPTLDLEASIAAPVDLVYRAVADVERYPEFLPDVTRVERRDDVVSMTLRMGLLPVTLVSRVRAAPFETIDLALVDGPFDRFEARWTFEPRDGFTHVRYRADYALPLVGALLAGPAAFLLEHAVRTQIRAFQARVRAMLDSPAAAG